MSIILGWVAVFFSIVVSTIALDTYLMSLVSLASNMANIIFLLMHMEEMRKDIGDV